MSLGVIASLQTCTTYCLEWRRPPACSHGRNSFPPHYAGINEQVLPAELFPSYTVVEYAPPPPPNAPPPVPPAFIFVLDLALDPVEIEVRDLVIGILPAQHCPLLSSLSRWWCMRRC